MDESLVGRDFPTHYILIIILVFVCNYCLPNSDLSAIFKSQVVIAQAVMMTIIVGRLTVFDGNHHSNATLLYTFKVVGPTTHLN